jgi:hypothetical protein
MFRLSGLVPASRNLEEQTPTRNRERKNSEAQESPGPVKEKAFTQQQNCYNGCQSSRAIDNECDVFVDRHLG